MNLARMPGAENWVQARHDRFPNRRRDRALTKRGTNARVIEFARAMEMRRVTPKELGALTKRLVETKNLSKAELLQSQIERAFYGD